MNQKRNLINEMRMKLIEFGFDEMNWIAALGASPSLPLSLLLSFSSLSAPPPRERIQKKWKRKEEQIQSFFKETKEEWCCLLWSSSLSGAIGLATSP